MKLPIAKPTASIRLSFEANNNTVTVVAEFKKIENVYQSSAFVTVYSYDVQVFNETAILHRCSNSGDEQIFDELGVTYTNLYDTAKDFGSRFASSPYYAAWDAGVDEMQQDQMETLTW